MRSSTQSVAGQPVADSAPRPRHHGVVPVAAIWLVSCMSWSIVCGGCVRPAAVAACSGKYTVLLMFELISTAYCLPSSPCPALTAPSSMFLPRSFMSRTPDRSAILPLFAMDRMMPGCGKIAMSGSWLPCTRVLISWLKFEAGENLMVMLFLSAHGLTTAWKSLSCWPVKPYMISMVLLVLLLPPPPPPELRHPAVSRATAPSVATDPNVDLMRMCTPSYTCSFSPASEEAAVRREGSGAVRRHGGRRPLADG